MADTMERFQEVLRPVVKPYGELTGQTTLRSLRLDALDMVRLVGDLEDEFGVEIADNIAEGWRTVADVVRTLEGLPCSKS